MGMMRIVSLGVAADKCPEIIRALHKRALIGLSNGDLTLLSKQKQRSRYKTGYAVFMIMMGYLNG